MAPENRSLKKKSPGKKPPAAKKAATAAKKPVATRVTRAAAAARPRVIPAGPCYEAQLRRVNGALEVSATDEGKRKKARVGKSLDDDQSVVLTLRKADPGRPNASDLSWPEVAELLKDLGDIGFDCGATCIGRPKP